MKTKGVNKQKKTEGKKRKTKRKSSQHEHHPDMATAKRNNNFGQTDRQRTKQVISTTQSKTNKRVMFFPLFFHETCS
jgi:hypothetical protein